MNLPEELPRPGGEGPPVPPLWQATLDATRLAQLISDLSNFAEVFSVLAKSSAKQQVPGESITLESAHQALTEGVIMGVQVRYRYDQCEWTDTILRIQGGYRLVRSRVE